MTASTARSAEQRSPASRWIAYFRERSPLAMLLLVGAGQAMSSSYLIIGRLDAGGSVIGAAGIVALLVLMRMMDELKDFERDKVAHPERPLPRGLLTQAELRTALHATGAALFAAALVIGITWNRVAGGLYAATVAYSFLMYREFFAPAALHRNAFVYALSHQVILLPMYAFAVACVAPGHTFSPAAAWFALSGLGASFTYEVGRKLDPDALPILETYLRLHGRNPVVVVMLAALATVAVSTWMIGVAPIVWPFAGVTAASLLLLYLRPRKFRIVESLTAMLMVVQMFAPAARALLGRFA